VTKKQLSPDENLRVFSNYQEDIQSRDCISLSPIRLWDDRDGRL